MSIGNLPNFISKFVEATPLEFIRHRHHRPTSKWTWLGTMMYIRWEKMLRYLYLWHIGNSYDFFFLSTSVIWLSQVDTTSWVCRPLSDGCKRSDMKWEDYILIISRSATRNFGSLFRARHFSFRLNISHTFYKSINTLIIAITSGLALPLCI